MSYTIAKYIQKPGKNADVEEIDIPTAKFEFFMMGLRKNAGISDTEYKSVFNEEIPLSVVNLFKKWQKK